MSERAKVFLDTSVLIAASDADHVHYRESHPLLIAATLETCACSAHGLAEAYAGLSVLTGGRRQRPDIAMRLVDQIAARTMVVSLTSDEYLAALHHAASSRIAGGTIYDALHIACARKVNADLIYTWNVRHFRLVAPDLSDRIVQPSLP